VLRPADRAFRARHRRLIGWLSLLFFVASVGLVALTFWIESPL
jgi:hypothetical protein